MGFQLVSSCIYEEIVPIWKTLNKRQLTCRGGSVRGDTSIGSLKMLKSGHCPVRGNIWVITKYGSRWNQEKETLKRYRHILVQCPRIRNIVGSFPQMVARRVKNLGDHLVHSEFTSAKKSHWLSEKLKKRQKREVYSLVNIVIIVNMLIALTSSPVRTAAGRLRSRNVFIALKLR